MLGFVSEESQLIPYERLMAARPVLLWALERRWTAEQAMAKGYELEADENSAWLVLEGAARVVHDGIEHQAGPGEWMFPKPGGRTQAFAGPFHFISITFRWQWPGGTHLFEKGLTRTVRGSDIPWLEEEARKICIHVSGITRDPYYLIGRHSLTLLQSTGLFELAAKWAGLFHRAMDHLGVAPDTGMNRDPRIEVVLEILEGIAGSASPSREDLAAAVGVSPRQLDRMMKQETGRTLIENHDLIRYEKACRSLLEKGRRVKEVAIEAGFNDLPGFSRWFAKRAGCAPRAFRIRFSSDP